MVDTITLSITQARQSDRTDTSRSCRPERHVAPRAMDLLHRRKGDGAVSTGPAGNADPKHMPNMRIAENLVENQRFLSARKGRVADPPRSQVITEMMMKAA